MARQSKKGACSSHTKAAIAHAPVHNDRRPGDQVPSYVNPHLTDRNTTIYIADDLMIMRGGKQVLRHSLQPLIEHARIEYERLQGQRCQASFVPLRESVMHVNAQTTDEQILAAAREIEQLTGVRLLGAWSHRDEGHYHSRYIEGDDDFEINYHCHLIWDCQDHATGKSIPMGRYYSQMQDILAKHTGMKRGYKAAETGARHRDHQQFRREAEEQRIAQLEQVGAHLEQEHAAKRAAIDAEQGAAIRRGLSAAGTWIARKVGAAHDEDLDELRTQIETLQQELRAERAARREEKKAADTDRDKIAERNAKIKALNAEIKRLKEIVAGEPERVENAKKAAVATSVREERANVANEISFATAEVQADATRHRFRLHDVSIEIYNYDTDVRAAVDATTKWLHRGGQPSEAEVSAITTASERHPSTAAMIIAAVAAALLGLSSKEEQRIEGYIETLLGYNRGVHR